MLFKNKLVFKLDSLRANQLSYLLDRLRVGIMMLLFVNP